jgi:hypothetical protein
MPCIQACRPRRHRDRELVACGRQWSRRRCMAIRAYNQPCRRIRAGISYWSGNMSRHRPSPSTVVRRCHSLRNGVPPPTMACRKEHRKSVITSPGMSTRPAGWARRSAALVLVEMSLGVIVLGALGRCVELYCAGDWGLDSASWITFT